MIIIIIIGIVFSFIHLLGIDFKMKCLEMDGKQIKVQVWYVLQIQTINKIIVFL